MKKTLILHPFLFAVFPVLALYAHNMAELSTSQLWMPLTVVFGLAIALSLLSWFLLRDAKKVGVIVSIFVILFFSFGHALDAIKGWGIGNIHISGLLVGTPIRYLLLVWAALFIGGVYLVVKTRMNLHNLTNIMNIIGITIVLISSISILRYELERPGFARVFSPAVATPDTSMDMSESGAYPDIYYIILDGYTGSNALDEFYHFDNSEFINYLSNKGFFIAHQSTSNYKHTCLSLPSSMNMEYINYISDEIGKDATDTTPLLAMLQNPKAVKTLKSRGYKYIHGGLHLEVPNINEYADIYFSPRKATDFTSLLYRTTLLRAFPVDISNIARDERWAHSEAALLQFEYITVIADMVQDIQEPVFVFAHILLPHRPFVFDRDGRFLTEDEEAERTAIENYVNQLDFCNNKVETMVDQILSKSEVPPVIILQGDHGHCCLSNWEELSLEDKHRLHMSILNAYHLPDGGSDLLYDYITPVNTFRVVFNYYLGTNYGLLNDENWSSVLESPYDLTNVTEIVRHN